MLNFMGFALHDFARKTNVSQSVFHLQFHLIKQ